MVFGKDAAVSAGRLEVNKIAGSHLSRDRREARVHGVPLLPLPAAFRGTAFQSRERMNTKSSSSSVDHALGLIVLFEIVNQDDKVAAVRCTCVG